VYVDVSGEEHVDDHGYADDRARGERPRWRSAPPRLSIRCIEVRPRLSSAKRLATT
jgi:hypothetical protein